MSLTAHPGAILRDITIPGLGISKKEFAARLDMSRVALDNILREKTSITPNVAVKLSFLLGGSAKFWLSIQAEHDIALAKETLKPENFPALITA